MENTEQSVIRTRCIDVHAHYVGQPVIDRIEAEGAAHGLRIVTSEDKVKRIEVGGRTTGMPVIPTLLDEAARLRWMDETRIDVQLVSGWMDLAAYHLPLEAATWLCRVQNEALSETVAKTPDRLMAAAMVPMQSPAAAAAELERAVRELGHKAVQIGARVEEEGLDAPQFDAFWAAAQKLDVPVIVHPADLAVPQRHRRLFLHILVGNPSETTYAAAALLLGGVFDRFPKLRVLLVHGGGCVPFQFGRIARGRTASPPSARGAARLDLDRYADNLYYDTVLHDDAALRYLISRVSVHRIALGSDYPFPLRDLDPRATVERLELSKDWEQAVCWNTAAELLGMR